MNTEQLIIDKLDNLMTRATRTESRLVQVADKIGVDVRAPKRIEILPLSKSGSAPVGVFIDSTDVTLHEIERAIQSAPEFINLKLWAPDYLVPIYVGRPGESRRIGSIWATR